MGASQGVVLALLQAWRGLQHPSKPVPKGKRPAAAGKPKPDVKKPQQRRNTQITAPVVMVIMPDGTKQEMALSAALAAAAGLGLDLVEVNAKGKPPVTRVMDWKKFAYEQQQKADAADKQRRQQQKLSTPKEMQFSARIGDHDLEVKMRKVAGWLDLGHRVQLVVKHGREEEAAATEALEYLLARVQADYNVEAGEQQQQRRAVTRLVKPLGAPGEAAKNKAEAV
ncbi:hypothetical protein OEZ85_000591 [Tetradesmus obliquus]|uniref:Translation initiation factor IF-3 n=1 Tax=Tetradesmus obliquus TaxID=3088 RepID=A0ABY8UJE9_TETOB|nr:hypothetical protein OEZ85_000591 [Tetradesmus obliquus]